MSQQKNASPSDITVRTGKHTTRSLFHHMRAPRHCFVFLFSLIVCTTSLCENIMIFPQLSCKSLAAFWVFSRTTQPARSDILQFFFAPTSNPFSRTLRLRTTLASAKTNQSPPCIRVAKQIRGQTLLAASMAVHKQRLYGGRLTVRSANICTHVHKQAAPSTSASFDPEGWVQLSVMVLRKAFM